MIANIAAVLTLLMIPVVPVAIVLVVLGLRGRLVPAVITCNACQRTHPLLPESTSPAFCSSCGQPLAGATVIPSSRRRNAAILRLGIALIVVLPAGVLLLFVVAVVQAVMTAPLPAGPVAATSPAVPPALAPTAVGNAMPALAPAPADESPHEVMARYTQALYDGNELGMVACFASSANDQVNQAIGVGVAKKAAMIGFNLACAARFGTEEDRTKYSDDHARAMLRWTNGSFTQTADRGVITPAPGEKKDLLPRTLIKTVSGWRIDPDDVIGRDLLNIGGGLSFAREKTAALKALTAEVREGKYATRELAHAAWSQAETEAAHRDMERVMKAIEAGAANKPR